MCLLLKITYSKDINVLTLKNKFINRPQQKKKYLNQINNNLNNLIII